MMKSSSPSLIKPFLKWAGGKTQLLSEISQKLPQKKEANFIYLEPFLGSGAVLFWVLNTYPNVQRVFVNDLNKDLINSYKIVKFDVENLIQKLKIFQSEFHTLLTTEEKKIYFYEKRSLFNNRASTAMEQAALLIFLNRTCFNGLYRVNKKNEFNVPMGSYKCPKICDEDNLRNVSKALENVSILCGDFKETAKFANEQAIFYLDPPYKPVSNTSNFNSYAAIDFNDVEQRRLKSFCDVLTQKGAKWILSNSDVKTADNKNDFFDELYTNYKIERVLAKRNINSKANRRGIVTELLISN